MKTFWLVAAVPAVALACDTRPEGLIATEEVGEPSRFDVVYMLSDSSCCFTGPPFWLVRVEDEGAYEKLLEWRADVPPGERTIEPTGLRKAHSVLSTGPDGQIVVVRTDLPRPLTNWHPAYNANPSPSDMEWLAADARRRGYGSAEEMIWVATEPTSPEAWEAAVKAEDERRRRLRGSVETTLRHDRP